MKNFQGKMTQQTKKLLCQKITQKWLIYAVFRKKVTQQNLYCCVKKSSKKFKKWLIYTVF